jgi:hypothetical protein
MNDSKYTTAIKRLYKALIDTALEEDLIIEGTLTVKFPDGWQTAVVIKKEVQ